MHTFKMLRKQSASLFCETAFVHKLGQKKVYPIHKLGEKKVYPAVCNF